MSESALARALACLAPLEQRFVVVGGTAHRSFPLHRLGRDPGFELLTTEDVDIAVDPDLEFVHRGSTEVLERLGRAGFVEEVTGAVYASRKYRIVGEDTQPYLQFIAPSRGDGSRREGGASRELRFAGIVAERLQHVDLLLHEPWSVEFQSEGSVLRVPIANPVAYLVQKLLILGERPIRKRGKDLLYVFDTLAVFSGALDEIGGRAHELLPQLSPRRAKQVAAQARQHTFELGDAAREAAVIAGAQRGRAPTARQIVDACRAGLPRLLASSPIALD